MIVVSKVSPPPGFLLTPAPQNRVFTPTAIGGQPNVRETDSEYRIFEESARRLGSNFTKSGTLHIAIGNKGTIAICGSCMQVMKDFSLRYPNITVFVTHGEKL